MRVDPTGWSDVVQRFAPYVYAVTVRGHRLPENAAAATFHGVFARTWDRIDELGDDDALYAWIVGITRELAQEASDAIGAEPPAAGVLERLDDALALREAIRRLPLVQQEAATRFWLRHQDERMIATTMGLAREAVVAHLRRARRRLRLELEPETDDAVAGGGGW